MPAQSPWAALAATHVISVDTRMHPDAECLRQIGRLPSQTWVSILDDRALSRFRLRRLVRRADLVLERELIVVPSIDDPLAVVEDSEWAVRAYWETVPSGVVRALPWSWAGLLSWQRVVLARRR